MLGGGGVGTGRGGVLTSEVLMSVLRGRTKGKKKAMAGCVEGLDRFFGGRGGDCGSGELSCSVL